MSISLFARCPVSLVRRDVASWLWRRFREAFPNALSVVLMPNHPHVLTPGDEDEQRWRLASVLNGLRRSHNLGAAVDWRPVSVDGPIVDPIKVARHSRYLHVNPCRAGIVKDPLEWEWSTHRDVMGAVADPWVDAARLAGALQRSERDFESWFHGYVSSDPTVSVEGTPPPSLASSCEVPIVPLCDVLAAAAAATREAPEAVRRKGSATRRAFLQLARRQGWQSTNQLAKLCRMSARSVLDHWEQEDESGVRAAMLCLGDPRLRTEHDAMARAFLRRASSSTTEVAAR